jgi:hypothetical protein
MSKMRKGVKMKACRFTSIHEYQELKISLLKNYTNLFFSFSLLNS